MYLAAAASNGFLLTHFEAVMGLLVACATLLSIISVGLRWIYRQGGANNAQIEATNANTAATEKLSGAFERFSEQTDNKIADHEQRITRVEDRFADLHDDVRAGRRGQDASPP